MDNDNKIDSIKYHILQNRFPSSQYVLYLKKKMSDQ